MIKNDGGFVIGEGNVVNAVVSVFVTVILDITDREWDEGDASTRDGVKKSEGSRTAGEVEIENVFWKP